MSSIALRWLITCNPLSEGSYEGKYHKMDIGYKSDNMNFRTSDPEVILEYPCIQTLQGDIRIELFYRSPVFTKKKRFARIWINTFFSDLNGFAAKPGDHVKCLVFKKNEIDIVWKKDKKNKLLAEDFELKLYMKVPTTKEEIEAAQEESIKNKEEGRIATEAEEDDSSGAEDDSDDENDWESGKSTLVAIEKSTVDGWKMPVSGRIYNTRSAQVSLPEEKALKKPRINLFSRSRGAPNDIIFDYSGLSPRIPNFSTTISITNIDSHKKSLPEDRSTLKMADYNSPPISPSIISNSLCKNPKISIATAFFDEDVKKLHSTASSGSIETNTTLSSSEATCSSNSDLYIKSKRISKSQSATYIYSRHDDLTSAASGVSPSSSGIHLSSSDAKVMDLNNSKTKCSFFKSLSKNFLFKK